MRIGIYHGYELSGSGSNEYNRYLSAALANLGHEVHMICREPHPEKIDSVTEAYDWENLKPSLLFRTSQRTDGKLIIHKLPHASIRPVYVTDKQRKGNVKAFHELTQSELEEYHDLNEQLLDHILQEWKLDILHANHLIYQPIAALEPCRKHRIPLIIFPHGSSIEYTVRKDGRYQKLALEAIKEARGVIVGNREMQGRMIELFPDYKDEFLSKCEIAGVGVDTSSFVPVSTHEREKSVKNIPSQKDSGGKTEKQTKELYHQLAKGDLLATRGYWDAYDHSVPDADLEDKLNRVDWKGNILLFVGALTVGKGLQSLICSLPSILKKMPNTHLLVVGSGAYREVLEGLVYAISTNDVDLFWQLAKKGKDLDRNDLTGGWDDVIVQFKDEDKLNAMFANGKNLTDYVHFIGRLDHSLLKHVFPCADIAIFPSVIPEAYPLVLMEALSAGVYPMVSYFSGFKDGVDELNRFLSPDWVDLMKIPVEPKERIPKLIDNVVQFLDGGKQSSIKSELRPIATTCYDWKLRAEHLVQLYEQYLSENVKVHTPS